MGNWRNVYAGRRLLGSLNKRDIQMKSNVVVVIAGAGGFGKEVAAWLQKIGVTPHRFIDDEQEGCQKITEYVPLLPHEQIVVAVANPKGRFKVVETLIEKKAIFHAVRHDICPPNAKFGAGVITCPMSVVSSNAFIGNFVHINVLSSIGHDVQVGEYCTISSHVDLCGNVTVGERTFIGSGAKVLPNVTIGADCVIGAGAIVVNDVPAGTTVYATPARTL